MPGKRPWQLAKGRKRATGMNSLEAEYAALLDSRLGMNMILWRSEHEAIKLKIADRVFLTFDFWVMAVDGVLEAHECKGGWMDGDAMVKYRTAAQLFPIRIVICRKEAVDCEPYRDAVTNRVRRKRHEWRYLEL